MESNARKRLEYVPDPNKFDLMVHRWDSQGHLVGKNPYRMHLDGDRKYFERPVNSGNLWYENNQPAGRVELEFNDKGHIVSKSYKPEAKHIEYTVPLSGADKMHYELEQERMRSSELQAELEAIKKERAANALIEVVAAPKEVELKVEPKIEVKPSAPTLSKRG